MRTRVSTRIIVPSVFALFFCFCAAGAAQAHFNLVMPPPISTDMGGGKGLPPCGSIGILTHGFPFRGSGQHGRIRPLKTPT